MAAKAFRRLPPKPVRPVGHCPFAENANSTIPVAHPQPLPQLTADPAQKELEDLINHRILITGDAEYVKKVKSDLLLIYQTPTGKKLLQSIHNSGKQIQIIPPNDSKQGNSVRSTSGDIFRDAKGNPGKGSGSVLTYNPDRTRIGRQEWETRPPAIGLAHELIHAEHFATGATGTGKVQNDEKLNPAFDRLVGDKYAQESREEVETAGIPPYDHREFTENKIRSEWSPKQPARKWY